MRSLGETQTLFRRAVAGGPSDALSALLSSPGDPIERLEIYRRHYRESFRRHLRGRYPTVEWLVGTDLMIEFTDALLRKYPPRAPSLAAYGEGLIEIVQASRNRPIWLADVAKLDWHLGCLSVAVEEQPLGIVLLAAVPQHALLDIVLRLQPGLVYLQSGWPVDQLIHLRLDGNAPEQLAFTPEHVCLELRGGRGRFGLRRLASAEYAFRRALANGRRLGTAAEHAYGADPSFDLSAALARLFAEGLAAAMSAQQESIYV
jgi:hypothetical protein